MTAGPYEMSVASNDVVEQRGSAPPVQLCPPAFGAVVCVPVNAEQVNDVLKSSVYVRVVQQLAFCDVQYETHEFVVYAALPTSVPPVHMLSLTSCVLYAADTVTVTLAVWVPPGPVQLTVYVVVELGDTL